MSIIERYISKEILQSMMGISLILLLILVGNGFRKLLEEGASGTISSDVIFSLLYLNTLGNLNFILPFAFYLATLLALGRLYKDSEMSALAACGVGYKAVMRAVLIVGSGVALLIAIISVHVSPWSYGKITEIKELSKQKTDVSSFRSGEFKASQDGRDVVYIEEVNAEHSTFSKVFAKGHNGKSNYIIYAESGYQERDAQGRYYLVLKNGQRYEGNPGQANYKVIDFSRYRLQVRDEVLVTTRTSRRALSLEELYKRNDRHSVAELQWRISLPIATMILGLMAVPLSRSNPRQGRYSKLLVAILMFAAYVNLIILGETWIEKGQIPKEAGLWWAHAAALLMVFVMVLKQTGIRWRFSTIVRESKA
ncbi:MAG: LPS export ABC transporter permease LptF [Gammaproteobacteria bacterium]|nr:LPS export ABC transporter permease LptF [Gammaproteobacteria bacterium]